jgi:polyribonucleotide nucleotidyltransferase
MIKQIKKTLELGGRTLTISTGKLANQATRAVLAQYGETVVMATVVEAPLKQEMDYFPLMVDYQERLYAGGRIKGSRWVKREGRPTDEEILTGRLIDRSIRPLFPKNYKKEVQVIVMVMSVDFENDPAIVAPLAVSAALSASSIPFKGPLSVLSVGMREGEYVVNPLNSESADSKMDLVVSSTRDAIVMIEAGAKEVTEEETLDGIAFAQKHAKTVLNFIEEFAGEVGATKEEYEEKTHDAKLVKQIAAIAKDKMPSVVESMSKFEGIRSTEYQELVTEVLEQVEAENKLEALAILEEIKKEYIRAMIMKGTRTDGRKHDQVRELYSEVGVLPRVHGSAIFQREATQVLTATTLGAVSMGQLLESAEGEAEKRYMHHYSMPPYASGEVGRFGNPGRREIGHGALAERALWPVIPTEDKFPYAIRVVSEVMSSNGSTSMASTCGSTLSLMDAGVPLTAPVSGIAMGLIIESPKKVAILSDIAGIEDYNGDMDFKVAGTEKGITALQLDVKTLNLTLPILKDALAQAKVGRAHILKHMLETIAEPKATVSTYAPKVKTITIAVEKIGELIGPGGKNIKKIIAETGAQVEVADDGVVSISAIADEAVEKAFTWIESINHEVQAGEIYENAVVQRLQPFGAFVEILPGKDGLVHVSDMAEGFVSDPADVVKEGDIVKVRVKEVDSLGRINLSMRMDATTDKPREERGGGDRGPRRSFGGDRGGSRGGFDRGNDRGPRSGGGGRSFSRAPRSGGFNRPEGGNRDRGASTGPHFPTSRLIDQSQQSSASGKGRRGNFDR